MPPHTHIARWDLDKTYLRTEFDTFRDLVKTALERADEKRTNPGASTLLREMVRANISVHILSGSPEQMRRRLEDKLRLDGITWDSFTLKPNLQNMLRLRFRALKDQLGYKLPALLRARAKSADEPLPHAPAAARAPGHTHASAKPATENAGLCETLFGDDAEADAFVYSLYGDICAGNVGEDALVAICEKGRVYEDVVQEVVADVRRLQPRDVVERVLIHLESQTPPDDFRVYGARVVPFYNYLQAAFVVFEDGRLPAEAVLRTATELVVEHRFDGDALARSYLDLGRRGHLRGAGESVASLGTALAAWTDREKVPGAAELQRMCEKLPAHAEVARKSSRLAEETKPPDYAALVTMHNRRKRRK